MTVDTTAFSWYSWYMICIYVNALVGLVLYVFRMQSLTVERHLGNSFNEKAWWAAILLNLVLHLVELLEKTFIVCRCWRDPRKISGGRPLRSPNMFFNLNTTIKGTQDHLTE